MRTTRSSVICCSKIKPTSKQPMEEEYTRLCFSRLLYYLELKRRTESGVTLSRAQRSWRNKYRNDPLNGIHSVEKGQRK